MSLVVWLCRVCVHLQYFNRALRLYAVREKQTILNSQTMYNQTTVSSFTTV